MSEKENPKISVIIPVYNTEEYLKECLDSVINQTLKDIEIILIDDGSTDNSGKFCDEYAEKDTRIKVIHQENQGLGRVRNKGLKIAKGEYIGFVDSDDWIAQDFYEKLYNAAIDNDSEIAIAKIKTYYYKKGFFDLYSNKNDLTIVFKSIVCDSIFRKSFLDKYKIKFAEGIVFEDVIFTLKVNCYIKRRFFYVDSYYYYRKDRKNSIMYDFKKSYDAQKVLKSIKECKMFLDTIKDTEYYDKAQEIFGAKELLSLLEMAKNEKSLFKFVKNEIEKINISTNCYISDYNKEKAKFILKANNYWQFYFCWKCNKKKKFIIKIFMKIKEKIIYFIYIILLKLGIKDKVKKILQKLGYKFDE